MRLIGESGGELSAPVTPETGNKAVEEEKEEEEEEIFEIKTWISFFSTNVGDFLSRILIQLLQILKEPITCF